VKAKVVKALKDQRAKEQLEAKAKEIASGAGSADHSRRRRRRRALKQPLKRDSSLVRHWECGNQPGDRRSYLCAQIWRSDQSTAQIRRQLGHHPLQQSAPKLTSRSSRNSEDQLTESMLSQQQDQVFADYIAGVQERMKRDEK